MNKTFIQLAMVIIFPVLLGCAGKKVTYVATGSAIGAGAGYAINKDGKDAAIGGLLGGLTGSIVADVHEKKETKKYKDGYVTGYAQAQLDMALQDWKVNTGKQHKEIYLKSYQRIKIPKREINDVLYESHFETLEVYR